MTVTVNFAGQNWLITPAPLAVNESPPGTISDQKWMLVLTGVVITNEQWPDRQGIHGNNPHDWRRLTVGLSPDTSSPLTFAMNRYGIPRPTYPYYEVVLSLDQFGWAPFAAVSSYLDTGQETTAAGVAVDVWRPTHFGNAIDVSGQPIPNRFRGIDIDVAVYGGAVLHRISYHITVVGKIAFERVELC